MANQQNQQGQGNNRRPSQNPTEKTKAVATTKEFAVVAAKFEEQFDKLLPLQIKRQSIMTGPRVTGLLVNLWMTNEDIRECPPSTIFNAVAQACAVGLEFNSALGQSYIIPYKNWKNNHRKEAQWQAGYRGLLTLAQRSEKVESPYAQFVMPEDDFEFEYGTSQFLRHKPAPRNQSRNVNQEILDKFIYAYFYVKMRAGGYTFHVMDREDVLAIRNSSSQGVFDDNGKPKPHSPWNKFAPEMIRKTPTKQHLKYLDLTPHLSMATGLDDQAEAGARQDNFIDWKDYSAEDVDNQTKGYTPGAGDGPKGNNGQQQDEQGDGQESENGPVSVDPDAATDDTKGPFEQWMFGSSESFEQLIALAKQNGHVQNQAQFIGLMGRFDGTKGEFVKMLSQPKGGK